MRYARCLVLGVTSLLLLAAAGASADTLNATPPEHDFWLYDNGSSVTGPYTDYDDGGGADPVDLVGYANAVGAFRTFFEFDLSGLLPNIDDAYVQFRTRQMEPSTTSIAPFLFAFEPGASWYGNSDWDSYWGATAYSGTGNHAFTWANDTQFQVDVTSAIQTMRTGEGSDFTVGFLFRISPESGEQWASIHNSGSDYVPVLHVEHTPEPSSVAVLIAGVFVPLVARMRRRKRK